MNYGKKVTVNGTALNVYTEGSGDTAIVFLAGGGVTCPVLEYKPVYRRMSEKYRIAVIEKAGYGFSGSMNSKRTVENLVAEDREALKQAGLKPPYVLAVHSYSGFEAVYWANTYPDEISALLSMDMGVPDYAVLQAEEVSDAKRDKLLAKQHKLMKFIAKKGFLVRLLKNKTENVSGLLGGNELTAEEKDVYRKMFYKNIANTEYIEESRLMTANAAAAVKSGYPKCPCCFFISDMKGMSRQISWRQAGISYAGKCGAEVHLSDKGHMMYARIPDEMAEVFDKFLVTHNIE